MALSSEFKQVTPRLRSVIESMPPFWQGQATSLIGGPHHGAGHRDGRAVDVGLPRTIVGWNFVVDAIKSGKFSAIGSVHAIHDDPAMQALAKQYGVDLFLDDRDTGATGDHVHLEVPK